jgi:hypothetical protein
MRCRTRNRIAFPRLGFKREEDHSNELSLHGRRKLPRQHRGAAETLSEVTVMRTRRLDGCFALRGPI